MTVVEQEDETRLRQDPAARLGSSSTVLRQDFTSGHNELHQTELQTFHQCELLNHVHNTCDDVEQHLQQVPSSFR